MSTATIAQDAPLTVDDYEPYVEAVAVLEQAQAQRRELADELAAAEAERDRITAEAGPDDLDRLEAAEEDVERARRRLQLADNQLPELSNRAAAAMVEARGRVLAQAAQEHSKLLQQAAEYLAEVEHLVKAEHQLARSVRSRLGSPPSISYVVTNRSDRAVERAGHVIPAGETRTVVLSAAEVASNVPRQLFAARQLDVVGPPPMDRWSGFDSQIDIPSLNRLKASIAAGGH